MRTIQEINVDIRAARSNSDAKTLLELARELQQLGTLKADASASHLLGGVCLDSGDYKAALEHYRRALAAFEELGDRAWIAHSTSSIGNVYHDTGDYPSTLEYCRRAMVLLEELGDRDGAAMAVGNIGLVYLYTGDFPAALDHFHRAIAVHEELGNRAAAAIAISHIGNVFTNTNDYSAALETYRCALAMYEELGDRAGIAQTIGNLGELCRLNGDNLSALERYKRALAIHEELGGRAQVAQVTGNVITTLIQMERFDEAADLLGRQAAMHMDSPDVRGQHFANKAKIAEHANDLDRAREHLMEALAIVTEAGVRFEASMYHQRLRDLAQKRNDFAGFIEHNAEYLRITEEIRGKEATQRISMMEADKRVEAVEREREKERAILYSALPKNIADRMVRGESVSGDHFDNAAVMFIDIVGFTTLSENMPARDVVMLLEQLFSKFDDVCNHNDVTKIKTIGDSYMAVAFGEVASSKQQVANPVESEERRVKSMYGDIANAALQIIEHVKQFNFKSLQVSPSSSQYLQVRIGLHCGPVTAGVIGTQRLQYDVWGDTVNVASRMESTSEPNRIHVSQQFKEALESIIANSEESDLAFGTWHLAFRGETEIKGKGTMQTYWLESPLA